ncbi:MAG: LLM class F420-dependent oxidoreductase [Nitrospinae bacterium]|nr:LLM class F420-dependent oxidoreductase [Nitrospinota bacterium]
MKIGIDLSLTSDFLSATGTSFDVAVVARRLETLGFESLWLPEHALVPAQVTTRYAGSSDGRIPDRMVHMANPFIGLARASAVTETLKLGTGVCLVPEHNPLLLAKEVATLDRFSGGRFLFGIGAGWLREKAELLGVDFPHRWRQTREAILAMKELWTKDEAEYHGTYYDFPPVRSFPKPLQHPHPPILLGGDAPRVWQRVVAWGDGWMPIRVTPEQVREGRAKLDDLAVAAGRDPQAFDITLFGQPCDPDLIQRFAEAGADRVILTSPVAVGQELLAGLERIAQQVLR